MVEFIDKIPPEVKFALGELQKAGYEAYIVGGCVRDLMRRVDPEDWDLATNARPEEIQTVFPNNYSDNKFGTIKVRIEKEKKPAKKKAGLRQGEVHLRPAAGLWRGDEGGAEKSRNISRSRSRPTGLSPNTATSAIPTASNGQKISRRTCRAAISRSTRSRWVTQLARCRRR